MSAAQFTPGPWTAVKIDDRAAYNVFAPGSMSALLTLEPGRYDGANPFVANVEADARLIAAAPELLAALQASIALADKNVPRSPNGFGEPLRTAACQAVYDQCVAAVAKATGSAP